MSKSVPSLADTAVPISGPDQANPSRRRARGQSGQATAEYALVLLGAAAVALLVVAWATKTDLIGDLFDSVMRSITGEAGAP